MQFLDLDMMRPDVGIRIFNRQIVPAETDDKAVTLPHGEIVEILLLNVVPRQRSVQWNIGLVDNHDVRHRITPMRSTNCTPCTNRHNPNYILLGIAAME